ncbi:MAG: GGDEF domain-containing protein [Burkholderiaceae bacterium]
MLSTLDIRTILFVSGITSLLSAAYLLCARPQAGPLRDAFTLFAVAVAMMATGFFLTGLTGTVAQSSATRLVSNLLVAGSTVAIWQGGRRIAGHPVQLLALAGCLVLLAGLLLPLSLDAAMRPWRHLLGTFWSLGFLLATLRDLYRAPHPDDPMAQRLAMGTIAAFSLLLTARIPVLVLEGLLPGSAAAQPGAAAAAFTLIFAAVPLALTIAVLAIANARLTAELALLAGTDDLTGLVSRRLLYELGEDMLAALPPDGCLAVLMIDLDDFKRVNDAHGHAVGDQVLRHVARLLRDTLREDSLIVRYGGDEFCALVPVSSEAGAFVVGERLRKALADAPCTRTDPPVSVTASIGVTVHRHDSSLRERLAEADRHAYSAKTSGRNMVVGGKSAQ